MFSLIFQILNFFKLLINFSIFSYVYKYFYESCSEKKIIKSKDNKSKKVIKTKIGLSFLYLVLLTILYFLLTWYVILTLTLLILTFGVLLAHKFEPSVLDIFKKYDSTPILKKIWYFYSSVVNLVLKIMSPIHAFFENKFCKCKQFTKNMFFEQLTKKDFNPFNSLFDSGIINNFSLFNNVQKNNKIETNKNAIDDFKKMNDLLNNLNNHD